MGITCRLRLANIGPKFGRLFMLHQIGECHDCAVRDSGEGRNGADGIRDAKKDKEGVNGRCFGLGLSLLRLSNRHTVSSSFWSIFSSPHGVGPITLIKSSLCISFHHALQVDSLVVGLFGPPGCRSGCFADVRHCQQPAGQHPVLV